MWFKDLCPTSALHAAHPHRKRYSDGIYLCKGGSLILILHVLISDFNPVWSAYVCVSFPSTPVIIKVFWLTSFHSWSPIQAVNLVVYFRARVNTFPVTEAPNIRSAHCLSSVFTQIYLLDLAITQKMLSKPSFSISPEASTTDHQEEEKSCADINNDFYVHQNWGNLLTAK